MFLSIESSAVTASACLTDDNNNIINSEFINAGLTHSETLLPLIKKVMKGYKYTQLDKIAVTVGPGSFTGIRIGVATAKGLAFVNDTKCVGVSTLEAIAYNFTDVNAVICACMDARRMQFYNALFEVNNGIVKRLTPDRAINIDDLETELKNYKNVIIAGDGAKLCYDNLHLNNINLADDDKIYQNAIGVSRASSDKNPLTAKQLVPVYLRPSQAERELKLKKENLK